MVTDLILNKRSMVNYKCNPVIQEAWKFHFCVYYPFFRFNTNSTLTTQISSVLIRHTAKDSKGTQSACQPGAGRLQEALILPEQLLPVDGCGGERVSSLHGCRPGWVNCLCSSGWLHTFVSLGNTNFGLSGLREKNTNRRGGGGGEAKDGRGTWGVVSRRWSAGVE